MKSPLASRVTRARRPVSAGLAAAAVFIALPAASRAQTSTWITNGSSNWNNAANWAGGIIADSAGNTANFVLDLTNAVTVTNDTPRTIGNLTFDDTGASGDVAWTLNGTAANPITLDNGGAGTTSTITASQTIGFANSVIIGAQLNGPSNVLYNHTAADTGSTRIFQVTNVANAYTGTTTVQNGFLNVGSTNIPSGGASPLGNSTTAIILGTAATTAVPAGGSGPNVGINVTGNGANNYTFARNVDSTQTANVAGRTNLRFVGNAATITGTLTVSGNWTLAATATRAHGLLVEGNNGNMNYTGIISGGVAASPFRLNDFGSGLGTIAMSNAANTYAGETRVVAGRLLINGDALAGSGVLGTNASLRVAESGSTGLVNTAGIPNVFPTVLTNGAFTVAKTVSLDNGNTNGGVQSAFPFVLGGNAAVNSSFTGNVSTIAGVTGRTLNVTQVAGGTTTFSGIINDNADATQTTRLEKIGAGTVSLSGNNTYQGGTRVLAGTLLVNNAAGTGTGAGSVNVGLASPASSGNAGTVANTGTTALNTRQINGISNAVAATLQPGQTVSSAFAGFPAGATIQAVSVGTGATTSSIVISANVAIPASTTQNFTDLSFGALTTTGTLGGSGTIAMTGTNTLNVNAGSTLAPGNSPGILTITGLQTTPPATADGTATLNLNAGSILSIEIAGTTPGAAVGGYDQVALIGTVALNGGTLNLTLGGFTAVTGQTFTIVNNDGTGDAVVGTFGAVASDNGQQFVVNYAGGDGNDITIGLAVPEPSTYALLGLGLGGLGLAVARRRRVAA